MTRPTLKRWWWPPLLALLVLLAGVLLHRPNTNPPRPAHPRSPAPPTLTLSTPAATKPGGANPGTGPTRKLARAYLRFLDGQLSAAQLPAATPAVRREAIRGGQIPARERAGAITLASIQRASSPAGARAEFVIVGHDHARSYPAELTFARRGHGWVAVRLLAPDLLTILARPTPPRSGIRSRPTASASPPAGATSAARRFLATYLPYSYGQLPARNIQGTTAALKAQLAKQPPAAPPAVKALHPVIRSLTLEPDPTGGWAAIAAILDGQQSYVLTLHLRHERDGWQVASIRL